MKRLLNIHIQLPLHIRVAALYVVSISLLIISIGLSDPQSQTEAARAYLASSPSVSVPVPKEVKSGIPQTISVPTVGIDLPVTNGSYDVETDTWTLTDTQAQFAEMTSQPNDASGNTFIYGHNTAAVFAPLSQLQAGAEVVVRTENKLEFTYRYSGHILVDPNATEILANTQSPRLTLMTCEGVFDQHRRVMFFDFVGVTQL